jgi:RNA-directed DNA polymerase
MLKMISSKRRKNWVLEADIKSFFDEIDHSWLLENIPMNKPILKQFLKAGFLQQGAEDPTVLDKGVPQGGVISPLISNLTLNGLERAVEDAVKHTSQNRTKHKKRFRAGCLVVR